MEYCRRCGLSFRLRPLTAGLCETCFKLIETGKCVSCGEGKPVRELWDNCKVCWKKREEEIDEWNRKYSDGGVIDE